MSTSKLQRATSERLFRKYGKYNIVENIRPEWLVSSKGERLELDFYIDELAVAVEVQGGQHFNFTPIFHDTEYDFKEQLRRDEEKLSICKARGINLLYVCKKSEIDAVVYMIDSKINKRFNEYDFVFETVITSIGGWRVTKETIRTHAKKIHEKRMQRTPEEMQKPENICQKNVTTIACINNNNMKDKARQRLIEKIENGQTTIADCLNAFDKVTTKTTQKQFIEYMGWSSLQR